MKEKVLRGSALVAGVLGLVVATVSQPTRAQEEPYAVSQLGLDLSVPESPAFTILGLNPENITHATSPRDFATQILNGVDRNGNFQSGLAVDLNLWGITERNNLFGQRAYLSTPDGYGYVDGDFTLAHPYDTFGRQRFLRNFLFRTSLSFATTKGTESEDKALRLAGGVRFVPWDPGDPKMLVGICIKRRIYGMEWVARLLRRDRGGNVLTALEQRKEAIIAEAQTVGTPQPTPSFTDGENKNIENIATAQDALAVLVGGEAGAVPTEEEYDKAVSLMLDLLPPLREKLSIKCNGDCLVSESVTPAPVVYDRAELPLDRAKAAKLAQQLASEAGLIDKWLDKYRAAAKTEGASESTAPAETAGSGGPSTSPESATESAESAPPTSSGSGDLSALQKALAEAAERARKKEEERRKKLTEKGVNPDAADKAAAAIVEYCKSENKGKDNRSSWAISAAPSWISADGSTDQLKWNGGAVWTSLSLGPDLMDWFEGPIGPTAYDRASGTTPHQEWWNVILHARYRFNEQQPKEVAKSNGDEGMKTALFDQDGFLLGGRLRFLVTESIHVSGEGAWIKVNGSKNASDQGLADDTYWQLAIVPSLKIPGTDNWWVDVAVGTDLDRKDGQDSAFVLSSIKYGFRQDPPPQ